jgi:hypothetical protein
MGAISELEQLDAALAARSVLDSALRLRLGQALEVMSRGCFLDLGFSSIGAYGLERCERSGRWAEGARCLARRLEVLPLLRRGLARGEVSWSMAELLARVASPANEAVWLERASKHTVRQMRTLVIEAGLDADDAASLESDSGMCRLTCTVDHEDAWLYQATRTLLEHLGVCSDEDQVEALLAEAQDTLFGALPENSLDASRLEAVGEASERWRKAVVRSRDDAEAAAEALLGRCGTTVEGVEAAPQRTEAGAGEAAAGVAAAAALGMVSFEDATPSDLDDAVREISRALARHELDLSQLIGRLYAVDGWRRMGYATEAQYARERLGMSRSSLLARRALASKLGALPRVAEALELGQLGVEAALQLVRVATPVTQAAWVERAQRRTVKHLREEVAAALVAVRLSGELDCPPPAADELASFQELERVVVSGRAWLGEDAESERSGECEQRRPSRKLVDLGDELSPSRRAWFVMLTSLSGWLDNGFQMSAEQAEPASRRLASSGRVQLRLWVSRSTFVWWRELEDQARRWLPRGTSWMRFVCLALRRSWRHLLDRDVAYAQIYVRDRWRCTSPVCSRTDLTPHHLQFRSAGGSDADDNVVSVCTWCHLFGIHGGRIRATGTADLIHWDIGAPEPRVVVHGRERLNL